MRGGSAAPTTSEEPRWEPSTNLELSERWRALAQKKRRRKRAARKAARMKHKAARAKRRMQELTFGTFNVRTAAFKGVNDIGHIDLLLGICAANGFDVIGQQETKRDGISDIVATGYRVYFSGDCSGVKGRKGQHGVGLAVKEEIVKKAGKESISARLLKARISIRSTLSRFW